jgi:hypothetical protein
LCIGSENIATDRHSTLITERDRTTKSGQALSNGRRAEPSTPMGIKLRADAQRLESPFACPCFSLAWARKDTARAADIGIAGLFIVGIVVLVVDHDRFAACLASMMVFRCNGRLDGPRCNQRRAENCDKRLSHFDLGNAGRPFPRSLLPFTFLRRLWRAPLKAAPDVSATVGEAKAEVPPLCSIISSPRAST